MKQSKQNYQKLVSNILFSQDIAKVRNIFSLKLNQNTTSSVFPTLKKRPISLTCCTQIKIK